LDFSCKNLSNFVSTCRESKVSNARFQVSLLCDHEKFKSPNEQTLSPYELPVRCAEIHLKSGIKILCSTLHLQKVITNSLVMMLSETKTVFSPFFLFTKTQKFCLLDSIKDSKSTSYFPLLSMVLAGKSSSSR